MHAATVTLFAILAACTPAVEDLDAAFYNWDDRVMHCPVEGDEKTGITIEEILPALDRARERGEVFELLVHRPGETMTFEHFETLLAAIVERGLAFVTYADMARGIVPTAGIALQYDDDAVVQWMAGRDLLLKYNARVTMFVTRYARFDDDARAQLRVLHDDGHDIEAHAVDHRRGPVYVEEHGLSTYLGYDVQPSIDILRNDGYAVDAFAYPFGDRTDEMDRAIAQQVPLIRSLVIRKPLLNSPCPY